MFIETGFFVFFLNIAVRSLILWGQSIPLLASKLHCEILNSIIKTSPWKTHSPHLLTYLASQMFVSESFKWNLSVWEPLNKKETLSQKHVLLSRCTDKNIWVTATAARVLSVWMTCAKLTSTHRQICHGIFMPFIMSLGRFYLTKEAFQVHTIWFSKHFHSHE